jgi:hypothetical protein
MIALFRMMLNIAMRRKMAFVIKANDVMFHEKRVN